MRAPLQYRVPALRPAGAAAVRRSSRSGGVRCSGDIISGYPTVHGSMDHSFEDDEEVSMRSQRRHHSPFRYPLIPCLAALALLLPALAACGSAQAPGPASSNPPAAQATSAPAAAPASSPAAAAPAPASSPAAAAPAAPASSPAAAAAPARANVDKGGTVK